MKNHFAALTDEKQIQILSAAYKEFALHGYKLASTNRIVEDAGIGKGMLFYYFENKHKLFLFLANHCVDIMEKAYEQLNDSNENGDFFDKYRYLLKIKMSLQVEKPYIIDFAAMLFFKSTEKDFGDDLKDCFARVKAVTERMFNYLYMNNDLSLFRKDFDAEKMMRYIKWAMDGYSLYLTNNLNINTVVSEIDLKPYWDEFYEYLDDMKKIYYA